jgi:hypothetical protein
MTMLAALKSLMNAATQGGVLRLFGETVTIGNNPMLPDGLTPTVTITTLPPDARPIGVFEADLTINEEEKISVFFSPDPTYAGYRAGKPVVAETLVRAEAVDPDQRPYTYRGEVRNVGQTNQEFCYQRPKKIASSGKR